MGMGIEPQRIQRCGLGKSKEGRGNEEKMQGVYYNSFKNICRCPSLADAKIDLISKILD